MRTALIITAVVQSLLALCAQAVTLPFEDNYVEPFYAPQAQIVWAVTNNLPATARVFKVIPAKFSPTALSNLTAMGGTADPKRGSMNLYRIADANMSLANVPDQARAYGLGTNILAKLEIPADELMSDGGKLKAGYSHGTRGRMDKTTRQMITEPRSMGIEFRRALDGVECFGQSVRIQFESQEAITQLEVKWHALLPEATNKVATTEQILSWIKEGRARANPVETTGSRWIKVADIKRVTIRQARLCYDADSMPKRLFPYLALQVEVEFSPGDVESVGFFCPIIAEAVSRPIRETGEFNIFPSTLNEKLSKREESK